MRKGIYALCLLLLPGFQGIAQDTLNFNGRHFEFLKGATDTLRANGNTYIVKYIVEPEMSDFMRGNGKIYVVITVLTTIFVGIFAYLVYLNRKIVLLEQEKVS